MHRRVAVVIPYYHSILTKEETIAYQQCLMVLKEYPIFLLVPDSMDESDYPKDSMVLIKKIPRNWLASVDSYNRMMLDVNFYRLFEEFEYILIYQLDAFVFQNDLERFCQYGYDYIGAPWLSEVQYNLNLAQALEVGNGGFSLRKIKSFIEISEKIEPSNIMAPEDVFWASCKSKDFIVAPVDVALEFAFETEVQSCHQLNGNKLPFGCHAWKKFDFDFLKGFFYTLGYDVDTSDDMQLDSINKSQRFEWESWLRGELLWTYIENGSMDIHRQKLIRYCQQYFNWKDKEIYLWGAGRYGTEFGKILKWMGIDSFIYLDVDREKQGRILNYVEIKSPEMISKDKDVVIIVTVADKERSILQHLEKMGYKYKKDVFFYAGWKKSVLSIV